MTGRRFLFLRVVRAVAVPLALAVPPLFWVADAARRASFTTLGRDQGIFQYIAWALSRGAVDYRDVRDVNGPFTHLVHLVFLALGGADEHRFHLLDLFVTGSSFALAGACVPDVGARRPEWAQRAAWALAACVVLGAQYLTYGYWDIAQRESFFDWLMLPSVALQIVAHRTAVREGAPAAGARGRRSDALMATVGALSVVPWFGKPTYVLFTIVQLAAIVLDGGALRRRMLAAFAAGGAAAAATQIAFVGVYGDVGAYLHIQLVDVPAMYRFVWPRTAADIFSTPSFATDALLAISGSVAFLALMAVGQMPLRVLGVALAPICGLASVVLQAKGFPYHFHPVTAATALQGVVLVAWLSERTRVSRKRLAGVRLVPVAAALALAVHAGSEVQDSPYIRDPWLLVARFWRGEPTYFKHFARSDFFPDELREAADYVRDHTRPDETVQTYGMDPYVLFLAGRMSATPYIYAYDLNVDAALAGGSTRPDEAQAARIRQMRRDHETDMLLRMSARPPGALVFVDTSPLLSDADAWADFQTHCSRSALWVRSRYRETARFGHDHVWLPLDEANELDRPSEPAGLE